MYYQNYDDYMRDVFYFNQVPNQNMGFNNMNMGCNMPNQNLGFNNSNPNMGNNMNQNYNNMYPDIYRIIQPVVSRVVTGNNYQYLNEDNLNSMVDTVYNIVEGEAISSNDENNSNNSQNNSQRATNSQSNSQTVSGVSASSKNNSNNHNSSNLLKDLIKILILKEIFNRNNLRRFNNNAMFGYQNIPNYYEQRYVF